MNYVCNVYFNASYSNKRPKVCGSQYLKSESTIHDEIQYIKRVYATSFLLNARHIESYTNMIH